MSRTLNRPAFNITAPTAPHPAAAHLGLKAARAVRRSARLLVACLDGAVLATRLQHRDYLVLAAAGLVERAGVHRQNVTLTAVGRNLAVTL